MKVIFEKYNDSVLYATVEATVFSAEQLFDFLDRLGYYQTIKQCEADFAATIATYRVDIGLSAEHAS